MSKEVGGKHGEGADKDQRSRVRLVFLKDPLAHLGRWLNDGTHGGDFFNFRRCRLAEKRSGMVACLMLRKSNNKILNKDNTKIKNKNNKIRMGSEKKNIKIPGGQGRKPKSSLRWSGRNSRGEAEGTTRI